MTWHAVAVPAQSAAELYPGDIESVLLDEEQIQARIAELGQEIGDGLPRAAAPTVRICC